MDNFLSAGLYTLLTLIVAVYYYFQGHKNGIQETIGIISDIDPTIMPRLRPKLQELANGTKTDSQ